MTLSANSQKILNELMPILVLEHGFVQGVFDASVGDLLATIGAGGSQSLAAGASISYAAGAGGLDAHLATGAFRFGTSAATIGFFGAAAASRPSAYTLTYSTTAKSSPAATTHTMTDSTTGVASTSVYAAVTNAANAGSADVGPVKNNFASMAAEIALLEADLLATRKLLNSVITDLQTLGLLQ